MERGALSHGARRTRSTTLTAPSTALSLSKGVPSKAAEGCRVEGSHMTWYVYILQCEDGAYYTGLTTDLERRLREHREGTTHYTGYNPPVGVMYVEPFQTKVEAERRETQIKRWSRAKKAALVRGDLSLLRRLSVSRD